MLGFNAISALSVHEVNFEPVILACMHHHGMQIGDIRQWVR